MKFVRSFIFNSKIESFLPTMCAIAMKKVSLVLVLPEHIYANLSFFFLGKSEMLAWIPRTWELKNVDLIGFSLFTQAMCIYMCVVCRYIQYIFCMIGTGIVVWP